jgi:hypothetical protein
MSGRFAAGLAKRKEVYKKSSKLLIEVGYARAFRHATGLLLLG